MPFGPCRERRKRSASRREGDMLRRSGREGRKVNSMNNVPSDKGIISQFFIIGDCLEPRKAQEAIHEGFAATLQIF